jgi:molybdopterin-guanine dinucleotide biosynthesis protein A
MPAQTPLRKIHKDDITGLLLAGGRGSRMGDADKGWQSWQGQPLVQHVLQRLAPQVGPLLISANRSLEQYRSLGYPVLPDALPDFPGPLAGLQAGLQQCSTAFLACTPCDTPLLPIDMVEKLAAALLEQDADLAVAATEADGKLQVHRLSALMRCGVQASLDDFLRQGHARVGDWQATLKTVVLRFDDETAFYNINTAQDLRQPLP